MAARSYFGKSVSALSLNEAALLAGITKGPNSFSPDRNPARARQRYDYVLTRMNEDGAISATEKREALAQFPQFHEGMDGIRRSYFADQVWRELKQRIAEHTLSARNSPLTRLGSNSNVCRFCSIRESVSRSSVMRASLSALCRMMPMPIL